MDLIKALKMSAAGMRAQGVRMRVVAENIANADTTPETVNGDPYRRKTVTFKNVVDRALGVRRVMVDRIGVDPSKFNQKFDPGNPAADERGFVRTPNVKTMVEMMDMKEAQRSYEANLSVIQAAKSMLQKTVELLRN